MRIWARKNCLMFNVFFSTVYLAPTWLNLAFTVIPEFFLKKLPVLSTLSSWHYAQTPVQILEFPYVRPAVNITKSSLCAKGNTCIFTSYSFEKLDPAPLSSFIWDSVTYIQQSTKTVLLGSLYSSAVEVRRPIKPGNTNRDVT